MAQTVHSGIVDLTGEDDDDNDNSIAKASAACEKAFAAASRLTNHFESLKTASSSNHYKNTYEHVDLAKKTPKPLIPPGVKISSNFARGVSFPRSALGADTSNIRTPRSAAISAKQNIAETCNELEEWVNKDPNLRPHQAGVSTPRKPGRAKEDSDEWSPSPEPQNNVEERKGLGTIITYSPTPSAGKHGDLTAIVGNGLSPNQRISTSLDTKKRKYSGTSQSRDSPTKWARWNEEPSAYHDSTPPNVAEDASRQHVDHGSMNNSPAGCFPRCVYPALKAAKAGYKQSLTEDELTHIGKTVSLLLEAQGGISCT